MFTHKLGLVPDFYVDLLNEFEQNVMPYDRGPCHFTTTSLSRGALEAALARENPNIEKEALDGIGSIDGTMLHYGLEMAAIARGDRCEVRRFRVLKVNGKEVVFSGCNDYETDRSELGKVMVDWKRTGAFAIVWGAKPGQSSVEIEGQYYKQDWVMQLNINRWLASSPESFTYPAKFLDNWREIFLDENGRDPTDDDFVNNPTFVSRRIPNPVFIPDRMYIGALLKDWDRRRALREKDYPNIPVQFVEMPWLSDGEIVDYIYERIVHHLDWDGMPSQALPQCSDKETWRDDDQYRVYDCTSRSNNPRSKGNMSNERDAIALKEAEEARTGKPHRIEHFPGMPKKCQRYCDVRYVCTFGIQYAEEEPWQKYT